MGLFGGGESFDPAKDIPDLAGKVILVTGGNTGLGFEVIRHLAAHSPSHIYLAARTPSKGEAALSAIKQEHPSAQITYLPLDLSSFESISTAVQKFKTSFIGTSPRLDILMNNAGIMAVPRSDTAEGYEIQFGTNHMGHAYLTHLLLPTLLATAEKPGSDVRIINLTSEGHNMARSPDALLDKEKLNQKGAWLRYAYSKLANVLFTKGLAKHYPQITSVAVHPGVIATDLWNPNQASNAVVGMFVRIFGSFRGTVATGARNQLWATTAGKSEISNGAYYTPVGSPNVGSPCAQNAKLTDELWEFTQREIGEKGSKGNDRSAL